MPSADLQPDVASVFERVARARLALETAGLTPANARLDAEVLARHALGWDRARLVTDGREPMPVDAGTRYAALIERRAAREPVAFITGVREFWGLEFDVSRDVLIPRPETELIVEAVRQRREPGTLRTIVDVGTGSGCLAVALAREYREAKVVAIDISEAALAVAARNAKRHGVEDRIGFVRGDLLDAVQGHADLIVSNPPYVPSTVALAPDIVNYEPATALYAGTDGLALLARLIRDARTRLAHGGLFVVEFGFGQDDAVRAMSRASGWQSLDVVADLQGIPRTALMH
jgi:release factor glutamine methyltransferase